MRIYQIIDSTNKEAARLLASEKKLHGTAILAFFQTDGLGQYGRRWHSEKGLHLAMSIILQPEDMKSDTLSALSMKIPLAIVFTLQSIIPEIKLSIKWPNDIYAESKKLAGILIENSLSASRVQHSIIGIGMNVNETYFPESIPNAVSLSMVTNKTYNIESLAEKIHEGVMEIIKNAPSNWKDVYHQYMYAFGNQQWFERSEEKFSGTVMGVDDNGRIIIEEDGTQGSYYSHEIKWLI